MSDLAPFVAAALRDKVVAELQEEIRELRIRLASEQALSQEVAITGPKGVPVYARTNFRRGSYDSNPELWKVEFLKTPETDGTLSRCSLSDFAEMEIRLGGICRARLCSGIVEAFANDIENNYDDAKKRGTISIWFGGASGIWLDIQVQPIDRQNYASLRDFELTGTSLLDTLLQFVAPDALVSFTEMSLLTRLVNGAMDRWGIFEEDSDDGN